MAVNRILNQCASTIESFRYRNSESRVCVYQSAKADVIAVSVVVVNNRTMATICTMTRIILFLSFLFDNRTQPVDLDASRTYYFACLGDESLMFLFLFILVFHPISILLAHFSL